MENRTEVGNLLSDRNRPGSDSTIRSRTLEDAAREPVRLNAELTKVMVHVEIGPAHAVGLGHRPKNGMHVRFVFGSGKSVKQGAQIGYICRKLLWRSATLLLVNFRPRRESWPPLQR